MTSFWRTTIVLCFAFLGIVFRYGNAIPEKLEIFTNGKHARPQVKTRWGRDPFFRKQDNRTTNKTAVEAPSEKKEDKLSLSAIIFHEGIGVAIINDQIVRKGDAVSKGIVVSRIFSDKVILKKGGEKLVLQVERFDGK